MIFLIVLIGSTTLILENKNDALKEGYENTAVKDISEQGTKIDIIIEEETNAKNSSVKENKKEGIKGSFFVLRVLKFNFIV